MVAAFLKIVVVTRVAKVPPASRYQTDLVTLKRSTLAFSLLAATVMTGWAAGATWLILSRDDFSAHMIKRETARQYVYEDRIVALKAEIDKLASRQLVNQDTVDSRVNELTTRQSQLESRHAIVAALTEAMNGQQIAAGRPARAANGPTAQAPVSPDPSPTSSISSFAPSTRPMPIPDMPGLKREGEQRRPAVLSNWEQSMVEPPKRLEDHLERIDRNIQAISVAQLRALSRLETQAAAAHTTLRSVINDVGLDADRLAAPARSGAMGGPFVPANIDPRTGPFEAAIARLQPRIQQVDRLRGVVATLPIRRPMGAEAEQTSGFGHRLDPFTRGLAMHTGVDFRAETGTPVRAAAPGRVVTAEYSGGYGNMVEIDHGNGLTTRYAHLSQISVSDGQMVLGGAVVGRVGSTGRSTGPHLHYETRIDGDAVDPARFLRAGQRFLAQAN